jgi:hypothetical protein
LAIRMLKSMPFLMHPPTKRKKRNDLCSINI